MRRWYPARARIITNAQPDNFSEAVDKNVRSSNNSREENSLNIMTQKVEAQVEKHGVHKGEKAKYPDCPSISTESEQNKVVDAVKKQAQLWIKYCRNSHRACWSCFYRK